jgi:hypothetical protein
MSRETNITTGGGSQEGRIQESGVSVLECVILSDSEGSAVPLRRELMQILRFAQNDRPEIVSYLLEDSRATAGQESAHRLLTPES